MLERRALLRPAEQLMRLSRMGQSYPHRLSFSRQLIRSLIRDEATVSRPVWQIDAHGHGRAVYSVTLGGHAYSLIAISSPLDDDQRSDRVIAEAWDACFTLFDGVPSAEDLDRLAESQIYQEAGRYSQRELSLSRANRSQRFFGEVRDALARGEQPSAERVNEVGYLMRTTAVYGNGKFGIADRDTFSSRPGMGAPFQAEMLTVWLIRGFTHDLVEHCAAALNPQAAKLDPALKRHLGVGNATGLGMAPFLVHHPELMSNWVTARETALAGALAENRALDPALRARALKHHSQWRIADAQAQAAIDATYAALNDCHATTAQALYDWAQDGDLGTQELAVSLILENSALDLEALCDAMACGEAEGIDFEMGLSNFLDLLTQHYSWALADQATEHWFWYVSENKLEPRVGARHELDGAERERPLTIVRDIQALAQACAEDVGTEQTVLGLLLSRPELTATVRRVFAAAKNPYSEIRDNLLGPSMRPIDMLRFKLAFFGATKFDPKSDLWTRITLFQGAPCRDAMAAPGDDWWCSFI